MPLLAHQESHRSEQKTKTFSNHCSGLRRVPPGDTGTMAAEPRIAKVKGGSWVVSQGRGRLSKVMTGL